MRAQIIDSITVTQDRVSDAECAGSTMETTRVAVRLKPEVIVCQIAEDPLYSITRFMGREMEEREREHIIRRKTHIVAGELSRLVHDEIREALSRLLPAAKVGKRLIETNA